MPRLRPPVPRSPIKNCESTIQYQLGLCRRVTYGRWLWVGPMRASTPLSRPPCAGTVERISMMKTLSCRRRRSTARWRRRCALPDEPRGALVWYPTWLAHRPRWSRARSSSTRRRSAQVRDVAPEATSRDLVVMHTSTPSFSSDVRTAEALKALKPGLKIGLIAPRLRSSPRRVWRPRQRSISWRAMSLISPSRRSPRPRSRQRHGPVVAQGRRHHRAQRGAHDPREHGRAAPSSRRSTSATS